MVMYILNGLVCIRMINKVDNALGEIAYVYHLLIRNNHVMGKQGCMASHSSLVVVLDKKETLDTYVRITFSQSEWFLLSDRHYNDMADRTTTDLVFGHETAAKGYNKM